MVLHCRSGQPASWSSPLPSTLCNDKSTARQTAVKLHRDFSSQRCVPARSLAYVGSADTPLGQWEHRGSLHARPNLPGKAFGYLKKIIITPAIGQCFFPLCWGLTYWYWAGFTEHLNVFTLTLRYVCIEQSCSPSYCNLGWGHHPKHPL